MSGKFETGNDEQKQGYIGLFGGDGIQYFFDLYFHWYNLVHETGHCIVENQGASMTPVKEEMYVNAFAVAYYRYMGEEERLAELEARLSKILSQFPAPMPEGETFTEFYERIWGTEALNNVMLYGYFQLNSVLEALKDPRDLKAIVKEIGIDLGDLKSKETVKAEIRSENAALFLDDAIKNLGAMGVDVPEIRLKLVDDPMVQCARPDEG